MPFPFQYTDLKIFLKSEKEKKREAEQKKKYELFLIFIHVILEALVQFCSSLKKSKYDLKRVHCTFHCLLIVIVWMSVSGQQASFIHKHESEKSQVEVHLMHRFFSLVLLLPKGQGQNICMLYNNVIF